MEYIVAGLLLINEMTLYELNASFSQGLSLIYSASYGSLQNAVKKLLKLKHIEFTEIVDNGRNKKIYRITTEGREAFYHWMFEDNPLNKLEVTMLSKVYFLGLIQSSDDQKLIVKKMIDDANAVEEQLHMMEEMFAHIPLPEDQKKVAKYRLKTLDYGIRAHVVAKEWLIALYEKIDG